MGVRRGAKRAFGLPLEVGTENSFKEYCERPFPLKPENDKQNVDVAHHGNISAVAHG